MCFLGGRIIYKVFVFVKKKIENQENAKEAAKQERSINAMSSLSLPGNRFSRQNPTRG